MKKLKKIEKKQMSKPLPLPNIIIILLGFKLDAQPLTHGSFFIWLKEFEDLV